jgi:hypothetical protein
MFRSVSNQGFAFWDENGDGSLHPSQRPRPSDDPNTPAVNDPTTWRPMTQPAHAIPVMSDWGRVLYPLLIAVILLWHLRRQPRGESNR